MIWGWVKVIGTDNRSVSSMGWELNSFRLIAAQTGLNPMNAESTFFQSTKKWTSLKTISTLSCWYSVDSSRRVLSPKHKYAKIFEKHLFNTVMLVFIGQLLLSTLRWVPVCQGFHHFSGCLDHFVLDKLATCSLRVELAILAIHIPWVGSFIGHTRSEKYATCMAVRAVDGSVLSWLSYL